MTMLSICPGRAAVTLVALLLGGCASLPGGAPIAAALPAPAASAPAPSPAAPPDAPGRSAAAGGPGGLAPAALDTALQRAGERLFGDALARLGEAPRDLLIDPLIDAHTGQQTLASVAAGAHLARLLADKFAHWKVQPLSRSALAKAPLLLIGSLTPVDLNPTPRGEAGPVAAFRIWLTLADLRTGKIIAKRLDRATPASVNAEPTRFFRDSMTALKDHGVAAYLHSAQIDGGVGDALDPLYLMHLPAAALLHEAINAYNDNPLGAAHRLFAEAGRLADADDLRALNGRYLTSWRLGRRQEAGEVMARIVTAGLAGRQLVLKVMFEPGGTALLGPAEQRAQTRLWLRELARQASARGACLRVVGHASRIGSAAVAQALSARRAAALRWVLASEAPASAKRFSAEGVGWRDNLVGLGTDDARDALDRRVEFRVVDCP